MTLNLNISNYKNFDYPLFRKYKNIFLDTAILFYSKLSDSRVEFINTQINAFFKLISKVYFNNFLEFPTFEMKTSKEIVDYYIKEKIEYTCMSGGFEKSKLIV